MHFSYENAYRNHGNAFKNLMNMMMKHIVGLLCTIYICKTHYALKLCHSDFKLCFAHCDFKLKIGQKLLMILYIGDHGVYLFVSHVPYVTLDE